MTLRDMQVDAGLLEVLMAEQQLNSPQIGTALQQVCGEAVAAIPAPE